MQGVTNYKAVTSFDSYDAIVIGSGVGGLTTAGLLAKAGKRVLVLEQHYTAGGATQTFRRKGYEWDVGLHYMGEVHKPGNMLRAIFDDLSAGALQWTPMPPVYNRIVIGDRVYDYPAGVEPFKARMKDYFPGEAAVIDRYIDLVFAVSKTVRPFYSERALPPAMADKVYAERSAAFRAFSDRTTLSVMRELTQNDELIAVLLGHFGDYACAPASSSFAIHAMLIRHYIDGASYPIGGSSQIAATIAPVIAAHGGAVVTSASVASVLVHGGKAVGVVMADGREIQAPLVISDAGAFNTITKLLPADVAAGTELLQKAVHIPASRGFVCLYVGIPESAAALGIDPANLWIHPTSDYDANFARYDADPAGTPLPMHFVNFPSAKDPTWETRFPGRTTIEVCSYTSYELFRPFDDDKVGRGRSDAYAALKSRLGDEMWEQVLRFNPQLRGKPDHMEVATPLTFKHFGRRDRGDFAGLDHTPERFRQRWLRPHTPVAQLFLTGQDVAADGVSGAMFGGMLCASAVLGWDVMPEVMTRLARA